MIDVVFLLLVFFVCASIGQAPEELVPADFGTGTSSDRQLPEPAPAEIWQHQQLRVRVAVAVDSDQPVMTLNEQPLQDLAELRTKLEQLAAIDPQSPLILDVDDAVAFQQFIRVYDVCQSMEFDDVLLAAPVDRP
ncbi:MAG: biopolymer transporter ExbD [Planctomycetaceae bacterium]|nr:biopolymer transporter ExbD [Planctomycetaceae bacterium]